LVDERRVELRDGRVQTPREGAGRRLIDLGPFVVGETVRVERRRPGGHRAPADPVVRGPLEGDDRLAEVGPRLDPKGVRGAVQAVGDVGIAEALLAGENGQAVLVWPRATAIVAVVEPLEAGAVVVVGARLQLQGVVGVGRDGNLVGRLGAVVRNLDVRQDRDVRGGGAPRHDAPLVYGLGVQDTPRYGRQSGTAARGGCR